MLFSWRKQSKRPLGHARVTVPLPHRCDAAIERNGRRCASLASQVAGVLRMASFGKRVDGPGGRRRIRRRPVTIPASASSLTGSSCIIIEDMCLTGARVLGRDLPREGSEILRAQRRARDPRPRRLGARRPARDRLQRRAALAGRGPPAPAFWARSDCSSSSASGSSRIGRARSGEPLDWRTCAPRSRWP